MLTPERALDLSAALACAAVAISTLEVLARREWLNDDHLLSWTASRLRYRFLSVGWSGRAADGLLRNGTFVSCLYVRLALALLAPLTAGRMRGLLLLALAALSALWSLRSPYGQDGSDQMAMLVTLSVAIADVAGTAAARIMALWFVAAQLGLSYLVAGLAKAVSPVWRSGEALALVLRTSIYGHRRAYGWLQKQPWLGIIGCWTVIALEMAFPCGILAPRALVVGLTCAMAAFHLMSAVLMGLNTFLLAFLAAYPCWVWLLLN